MALVPDAFASDPDRVARFTREARTLAALNHPHIAHIPGLEESHAVRALVMEHVDMIKASGTGASGVAPALVVVQRWDEELKRLVPSK